MHPRVSKFLLTTTALSALGLVVLGAQPGTAGPEGGTVVGGAATIAGQGSAAVVVNQSSSHAIINWHTFNVGAGQSVTFNQPGSSSIALNRVTGGLGPSEILGTLSANGKVFVINRDGILFGPGAVINTAGFLATTNDIKNSDFMAGRMNFNIPGRPDASIVNLGNITATSGGFAALVAPGVRNSGTITATLGTVTLAAGNSFTLDLYGDKLITLAVNDQIASKVIDVATGQPLKSLITNDGKIKANGGRVELTAAAARHVVDSVINTSGVIKANSIGKHNGMIVLSAATGGTKGTGAPAQTIKVSGTLSAAGKKSGTTGGTILVTGEDIQFVNALVDASGSAGGGKVLIGGDWGGGNPTSGLVNNQSAKLENFLIPTATTVSVDAGTTINASAKDSGNGGKVILWSDVQTTFAGTILARGGAQSGNGGFVETSGHQQLAFTGNVDTRAPNGANGTLLLDPHNIIIRATGPDTITPSDNDFTSNVDTSVLTTATLVNALSMGNVIVETGASGDQQGNITVASSFSWGGSNSLTLSAHHNITVDSPVIITHTGSGNLTMRADSQGTGSGTVNINGAVNFSGSTGQVSIYYNPPGTESKYQNPTTFGAITGQLKTYMLVNNAGDLDLIGATESTRSAQYALGRDFSAYGFDGFPTGTTFTNEFVFDGNGGLGVNHTISDLTLSSSDSPIGLFPILDAGATVRNLNLDTVNVTATGVPNIVGTVAGISSGAIVNVHVSNGTVSGGGSISDIVVGGLVGQLESGGTIAQSSASAVNVTSFGTYNTTGGLVGVVQAGASITDSNSTGGIIAGGVNTFAGGLVGRNDGSITNSFSSNAVSGTSQNGSENLSSAIGGLVGFNTGVISGSNATGSVSGTAVSENQKYSVIVGGLVGLNNSPGQIINSHATGAVTGTGKVELGGLVGANFASVSGSYATGSVSTTDPSSGQLGGLVGFNNGASATITGSNASGPVTGTGSVILGGLVGLNDGGASISNSFATGAVTASASGMVDYEAGGLVGENDGHISGSYATGSVTGTGGQASLGGLAGTNDNGATITNSSATGTVVSIASGIVRHFVGGLAGQNGGLIANSNASGAVTATGGVSGVGGLVGINFLGGSITQSFATGAVSGDADHWIGGLVGNNDIGGAIAQSYASGPVIGGASSYVGGLVGFNGSSIMQSYATGSVVAGTSSILGGLIGVNVSSIEQVFASGSVTGASNSIVGGLVGLNTGNFPFADQTFRGVIFQAYATGSVTGGASSFVGGLAGQNAGTIDQAYSIGEVSGGSGSTLGGLLASNTITLQSVSLGNAGFVSFPTPGIVTNSYWDPATTSAGTSAAGSTRSTQDFLAALPPGFSTTVWGLQPNPSYPHFAWQPGNSVPTTTLPPSDLPPLPPPTQVQIIDNLIQNVQLAALNTTPPLNLQGGVKPPQFPPAVPPGFQPPPSFPRLFDIPPLTETRFISDEVMVQITSRISMAELESTLRRFGLTLLDSERLAGTDTILLRFRITDGKTVREIIQLLASTQIDALVQPNYFFLADQKAEPASRGDPAQQGDAAQYILQKLKLPDVHRLVRGTNVPIAVIDSEIDAAHPDLQGVIAQRFSAVGAPEAPHSHGTGMAGAIASRLRVIGVAPSSRLLAVHAFSTKAASAESTTFNILKGIDWSVSQGARIINMSFAGPKDPSLERALKAAYDKGVVLIAAAGNAGPKSPPLYPGADPYVIAVTATDADDKLFVGANRGKYVAVAAPGVDILVPAPDNTYQLTTGTSVAAAEVSGVVALLLERNPRLTPADVRRILTGSAKRLGAGDRDDNFGSGLVDPLRALQSPEPRTVTSTLPRR